MNIFIDNNILMSFLGSDSNLPTLEELIRLVEQKKVNLLVTEQLDNEYFRDAGDRIQQEMDKCESWYDSIIKITKESGDSREKEKKIKEAETKASARVKEVEKHTEEADKLIKKLLSKGVKLKVDDNMVRRAQLRILRGNPPGKKNENSHGDAISWECLLESSSKDDLKIVTVDPDFAEQKKEHRVINRLLSKEWTSKHRKTVSIVNSLGELINSIEKKETIKKEVVDKERAKSIVSEEIDQGLSNYRNRLVHAYPSIYNFPATSAIPSRYNDVTDIGMSDRWNVLTELLSNEMKYCPYCGKPIVRIISSSTYYKCPHCNRSYNPLLDPSGF